MSNEVTLDEEAHVRPEDAGRIAGAQAVEDKVRTRLDQLEANANLSDDDNDWRWYATMAISFIIGSLFSGFELSGGAGGGGGGPPMPVGMVDPGVAMPALEVMVHVV